MADVEDSLLHLETHHPEDEAIYSYETSVKLEPHDVMSEKTFVVAAHVFTASFRTVITCLRVRDIELIITVEYYISAGRNHPTRSKRMRL
jgi:hypothetical protein